MQTSSLDHDHANGGEWGDLYGAQTLFTLSDWPFAIFFVCFFIIILSCSAQNEPQSEEKPCIEPFPSRFPPEVYSLHLHNENPSGSSVRPPSYLPLSSFNSITTAAIDASESADFCG